MKRLLTFLLIATSALAQPPASTPFKNAQVDSNGNLLPTSINGHVLNLPVGTTLGGASIGGLTLSGATSGHIITAASATTIQDSGTALSSLAVDSAVVHKTGTETVAGVKTLTSQPILSLANPSMRLTDTAGVGGSGQMSFTYGTNTGHTVMGWGPNMDLAFSGPQAINASYKYSGWVAEGHYIDGSGHVISETYFTTDGNLRPFIIGRDYTAGTAMSGFQGSVQIDGSATNLRVPNTVAMLSILNSNATPDFPSITLKNTDATSHGAAFYLGSNITDGSGGWQFWEDYTRTGSHQLSIRNGTTGVIPIAVNSSDQVVLANALGPAYGGTGIANNAAATLTRSGNHALTITTSGTTGVTLPTSGTLTTTSYVDTFADTPSANGSFSAFNWRSDLGLGALATVTPGTGVGTALAVNVGTAGSFLVNGGVLGTPSSGTVTNLTGTASININGTVGATTPAAGTFTTVTTPIIKPSADSTTAIKITKADGTTAVGTWDTTNSRLGIGTTPTTTLDILKTQDAATRVLVLNTNNSGTSARTLFQFGSVDGSTSAFFGYNNTAFNLGAGYESLAANRAVFGAAGGATNGIGIVAAASGAPIVFYTDDYATANERARINSSGLTVIGSGTFGSTTSLLLGTAGSAVGNIGFRNATSGTITISPPTGALGTSAVTLPGSGTLATLAGSETFSNKLLVAGIQALSGAGAVNVTNDTTAYTSTGAAEALTLANGANGQIKRIAHVVKGTLGTGVLTPTTKTGFSTITFTNAGDAVTLEYFTTQGWIITGQNGVTVTP